MPGFTLPITSHFTAIDKRIIRGGIKMKAAAATTRARMRLAGSSVVKEV